MPICLAILLFALVGCSQEPTEPAKENVQIYSVDIAPNGEEVATLHSFDYVTTRNISTNEVLCSWNTNWRTQTPHYSHNGDLLLMDRLAKPPVTLFGYSHEFVFFDTKTCKQIRKFLVKELLVTHSIEFSRNGKHILRSAVDSDKGVVQIQKIELETGKLVRQWTYSNSYPPNIALSGSVGVALSGDGTTLAVGLSQHESEKDAEGDRDNHLGRVILTDFVSGEVVKDWLESDTVGIGAVDLSFDAKILVLGFRDGIVKTLHLPSDTSKSIVKHSSSVVKLMISPGDQLVFSSSAEDAERLVAHRLDTGELVHEFQFGATIHDFDISRDGETLIVGTGGVIEVVKLNTKS